MFMQFTWWVITIGSSSFSLGGLFPDLLPEAAFSAKVCELCILRYHGSACNSCF